MSTCSNSTGGACMRCHTLRVPVQTVLMELACVVIQYEYLFKQYWWSLHALSYIESTCSNSTGGACMRCHTLRVPVQTVLMELAYVIKGAEHKISYINFNTVKD